MQVPAGIAINPVAERLPVVPLTLTALRAPTPSPTPSSTTQKVINGQQNGTPGVRLEPLLTFRRDPSGRAYYVISDAQTGRELAQLPPEALRNIGEGIESFLKQQEQKRAQNSHIEAEA